MCVRWVNWMRQVVLRPSATRPVSRYRPLIVEECESRLALSAWFPATYAEGGFIDIYALRFNAYDGPSPGGDAGGAQPSWITTNIGRQQPEVALIVADELTGRDQEGGLIDLTLVDRETSLAASSLPLGDETVFENLPLVTDMPGVSVPATSDDLSRFVPSTLEPAASVQVPPAEDVAPDSFVPVSFTIPTEERIDGARGRARVFDLAIRTPATPVETSTAIEPLSLRHTSELGAPAYLAGASSPSSLEQDAPATMPPTPKSKLDAAPDSEVLTPARPARVSAPVTERSGAEPSGDPTEAVADHEPPTPNRKVVAKSSPAKLVNLPEAAENESETFPDGADHDRSIRDGIFSYTERFLAEGWYREVSAVGADSAEGWAAGVPTEYTRYELSWVTEPRTETAHPVGNVAESSFAGNSSDSQAPVVDNAVADRTVSARRENEDAETKAVEKKTDLDRGHAQMSASTQKASTGKAENSELPLAYRDIKPAPAQKADADDGRAEHGKTADVQRPAQIAAVLATGAAGHYLGTRRRHRSIDEPPSLGRSPRAL